MGDSWRKDRVQNPVMLNSQMRGSVHWKVWKGVSEGLLRTLNEWQGGSIGASDEVLLRGESGPRRDAGRHPHCKKSSGR